MIDRYDQNLLLGYVEGELSPEERARFEKELADDPQLRRLLDQIVADREALQTLPQEIAPPGLVDDALGQLERRMLLGEQPDEPILRTRAEHTRRYRLGKVIAYAGVAAVLALSFGLVFISLNQSSLLEDLARYAMVSESAESAKDEPRTLAQAEQAPRAATDADAMAEDANASTGLALAPPAPAPDRADAARDASPSLAPSEAQSNAPAEPAPPISFFADRLAARADTFSRSSMLGVHAQPQAQIEIDTVDAAQTWQQVREWAEFNQVRIVDEPDPLPIATQLAQQQMQAQVGGAAAAFGDAYRNDIAPDSDMEPLVAPSALAQRPETRRQQGQQQSAAVVTQRATLELSDAQMRELVERLNRDERQAARVQIAALPADHPLGLGHARGYAGDGALPRGAMRSNVEFSLPDMASNAMPPSYEQMAQADQAQRNEQAVEPSASPLGKAAEQRQSATAPLPDESLHAPQEQAAREFERAQRSRVDDVDGQAAADDTTAAPIAPAAEQADDAVPSLNLGGRGIRAPARASADSVSEANGALNETNRAAAPEAPEPSLIPRDVREESEPIAPLPDASAELPAASGSGTAAPQPTEREAGEPLLGARGRSEAGDAAAGETVADETAAGDLASSERRGLSIDAPALPGWSDWSLRLSEQTPWAATGPALPPRGAKQTVRIILRSPDAAALGERQE